MEGIHFFWLWLLKYSAILSSCLVTLAGAWLIDKFVARRAKLVYYTSHQQWVTLAPPPPGQQQVPPIGTFTLYVYNQGKAPAREVHIGHLVLPDHAVYPDIPREIVRTPSGGTAIKFPVIPPKTLITISYLVFGTVTVEGIISYVGSEEGAAQRVPVILQRLWPGWWNRLVRIIFYIGAWVVLNAAFTIIRFLWIKFYV